MFSFILIEFVQLVHFYERPSSEESEPIWKSCLNLLYPGPRLKLSPGFPNSSILVTEDPLFTNGLEPLLPRMFFIEFVLFEGFMIAGGWNCGKIFKSFSSSSLSSLGFSVWVSNYVATPFMFGNKDGVFFQIPMLSRLLSLLLSSISISKFRSGKINSLGMINGSYVKLKHASAWTESGTWFCMLAE